MERGPLGLSYGRTSAQLLPAQLGDRLAQRAVQKGLSGEPDWSIGLAIAVVGSPLQHLEEQAVDGPREEMEKFTTAYTIVEDIVRPQALDQRIVKAEAGGQIFVVVCRYRQPELVGHALGRCENVAAGEGDMLGAGASGALDEAAGRGRLRLGCIQRQPQRSFGVA